MEKMIFVEKNIYKFMRETVGTLQPESGVVIGVSSARPDVISRVWFDQPAGYARRCYHPSSKLIEQTVYGWQSENCRFAGIVHSHPEGFPSLSRADLYAAEQVIRANGDLDAMIVGLFYLGQLKLYQVTIDSEGFPAAMELLYRVVQ